MTASIKNDSSGEPLKADAKKPYQAPAFRFERVFEVSALSCGKRHSTEAGCHQNRKTS